jgi:branched-chain amino acid transport system substrate-binding protein
MRLGARRWALALCALLACQRRPTAESAPQAAPQPSASQGVVLIGMVGPLTGQEAHFGLGTRDGVALALEEANVAGGINGRPLRLRAYDSQSKPEDAATATVRLVQADNAVLVIGDNTSSDTLAMAPAVAAAHVPLISPSATNPRVTKEGGPYVFRVCFVDSFQGEAMAGFVRRTLKLSRVAILTDLKSDYSIGLADYFRRRFAELGGTVVAEETYAKGDTDFRGLLTRVKSSQPDGIFIPGYYSDAGPIARQARELGIGAVLFGGDGWDGGGKLTELGGSAVEGSYYSTHFSPDNPSQSVQRFLAAYQARFGRLPDALSALGYDAARLGIAGLRTTGGVGGPTLRDVLARTRDFEGVTGRISLGPDRSAVKSAVVVRVVQGAPTFFAEVLP